MKRFCPCLVQDTSHSEEHSLQTAQELPALSPRYSRSEPQCFCGEPNHCHEDDWIVDWEPYYLPCVFESWDCLRYHSGLNCAMKKGTEVFQIESQRGPLVFPGDVDNDKDTEEPDKPSPSLLREKELELETCDGGDCSHQDPAFESPKRLGFCLWLQRVFGQEKK
ncbi:uncharacterized protein LOC110308588 [Mus caroli]|uniref:Uncharacterized protein LOC110308588 n=1 Tax=Mus caroli TaxID=10089 RepID=A0A6P5R0N0_MUSCR|nr:uncharacterized protein LOC110308588 [Mus caroli]